LVINYSLAEVGVSETYQLFPMCSKDRKIKKYINNK